MPRLRSWRELESRAQNDGNAPPRSRVAQRSADLEQHVVIRFAVRAARRRVFGRAVLVPAHSPVGEPQARLVRAQDQQQVGLAPLPVAPAQRAGERCRLAVAAHRGELCRGQRPEPVLQSGHVALEATLAPRRRVARQVLLGEFPVVFGEALL
jgi:hypothetical protein